MEGSIIKEEVDISTEKGRIKPDHSDEASTQSHDLEERKGSEVKHLENGTRQEQSDQGTGLENGTRQNEAKIRAIPQTEASGKQNLVDSSHVQIEDLVRSQDPLEESEHTLPDQEDHWEPTSGVPTGPEYKGKIKCICGTGNDDGKLACCKSCDTWQHAECYYIDEYGIVPTNQDLKCIDHYCAGCAPRTLHVDEAIERKRSQQVEIKRDKSKDIASFAAEPRSDAVMSEPKIIPSEHKVDGVVASTAVEELTSEMESAFGGTRYLPPISQAANMRSGLVEPPIDANVDDPQEESPASAMPSSPVGKPTLNKDSDGPLREEIKMEKSPTEMPSDTHIDQSNIEPTALDDKASMVSTFDSLYDASLPVPSVRSTHDNPEEPTQDQTKKKSPSTLILALSLKSSSLIEAQNLKIDEGLTYHPAYTKLPEAGSNSSCTDPKGEGDGLDAEKSRIEPPRSVGEETANANAPSPKDTRAPPNLISTPPSGFGLGFSVPAGGNPLKLDTGRHGRGSFESKSISIDLSHLPNRLPPLPQTTQSMCKSATVESTISFESPGRISSTSDPASTVSSERPEISTVFTSKEPASTAVTSPESAYSHTTRTRAQSDLRRLQTELTAAKDRGDSKAKEDSLQKSIQVIWDTYLTPQPEDAVSQKKSSSPRLGSRASLLRLPSFSGSTKSRTAFCNAISCDDETSIRKLLDEKANVNGRTSEDKTPLMQAASLGHMNSMKILKEYGADECARDARGRTALHIAVAFNHVSTVKWLLEAYPPTPKAPSERTSKLFRAADLTRGSRAQKNLREVGDMQGSTALHVATERGMGGMLKMLLAAGLDIEARDNLGRTPLLRSVLSQKRASFDTLLQYGANASAVDFNKMSALHFAAASDQVGVIKGLLAKGIDRWAMDDDGAQALHHAGRNGHIPAITALISSQADLNTSTKTGARLLHIASAHNNLPLAEHLLTSNVDVNPFATPVPTTLRSSKPVGTQLTPLHYACVLGHLEISMLLLKHMAWVNAPTNTGVTALMMAAEIEDTNLVNILLEAGAKVNASVPGSCLTALHISARKGDLETVQQLCRAGADHGAITSGGYPRNPLQEAIKYAKPGKGPNVVEYLRILQHNRLRAKGTIMCPPDKSALSSNTTIRAGPGTPMAASQNNIRTSQRHEQTGGPMNGLANGPEARSRQGIGQFGMAPGAPPINVGPQQQPLPKYQQHQHLQQQQYFDPLEYEAIVDSPPKYEPGAGAPARLIGRAGVHRVTP